MSQVPQTTAYSGDSEQQEKSGQGLYVCYIQQYITDHRARDRLTFIGVQKMDVKQEKGDTP